MVLSGQVARIRGTYLSLKALARWSETLVLHSMLKRVILPTEHVIAMLSIARAGQYCQYGGFKRVGGTILRITVAQDERLRAILRPVFLLVEGAGIPDNFVVNLRDLDGVRRRALSGDGGKAGGAVGGVRNVINMVGAVEVLSVPATS